MFDRIANSLKNSARVRFLYATFKNPITGILGFIYGAYLTLRYVDSYNKFTSIIFQGGLLRLHIRKRKYANLISVVNL
jgi:hypothetical protein